MSHGLLLPKEKYGIFCRLLSNFVGCLFLSCIIFLFNFRRYYTMQNSQHQSPNSNDYIHASLLHLGVIRWNKSSRRLERALEYVIHHDSIPDQPVKCLYADLAKAQKCSWKVIERSLRYAIHTLWDSNTEICSRLFLNTWEHMPCPCVSEFLSLYVSAFQRGAIQEWIDSYKEQTTLEVKKADLVH